MAANPSPDARSGARARGNSVASVTAQQRVKQGCIGVAAVDSSQCTAWHGSFRKRQQCTKSGTHMQVPDSSASQPPPLTRDPSDNGNRAALVSQRGCDLRAGKADGGGDRQGGGAMQHCDGAGVLLACPLLWLHLCCLLLRLLLHVLLPAGRPSRCRLLRRCCACCAGCRGCWQRRVPAAGGGRGRCLCALIERWRGGRIRRHPFGQGIKCEKVCRHDLHFAFWGRGGSMRSAAPKASNQPYCPNQQSPVQLRSPAASAAQKAGSTHQIIGSQARHAGAR